MTARLTDDQLRELLELEAKATPGPWTHERYLMYVEIGEQKANEVLIPSARNALRPLVEELLEARKLLCEVAEQRLDPDLVRRVEERLNNVDIQWQPSPIWFGTSPRSPIETLHFADPDKMCLYDCANGHWITIHSECTQTHFEMGVKLV